MYEDDSGRSELDGEREYYWEQAWSDLTREDKWESPWGNAERGMANKDPDWGWPADASELRRLRQAAEIGDIAAMRQLAKAYYSGFGATRDFEESVKWQARAEKSGDAETALALVRATLDKECPDKLAHWEQTVVELCSVETICALGNLYRRQANGEYKAARFYEIAAGRGCLEAQLKLARLWLERWKDSKIYWRNPGWRWLVAAFDNHDGGEGSPAFEEMRRIADEYGIQTVLNDIGLPRLRRALYGESRTAAKPSREAGEHLRAGTACLRQGGPAGAARRLCEAAKGGSAKAARLLRDDAQWGRFANPQELGEAADAICGLGNWFADCDAWDDAYDWWKVAARRGNAAAQYDVARAYDEGCYDIEHEEAVKWYRMAAAQGHAKAEDNLCEICFFWNHTDLVPLSEAMGYCLRGEMRDSERARDFRARHWWWLRDRKRDVAASPGSRDSAAQYRLAQSLHHARRDVVAAVPHYRRAARLGSADAQYQLAKISLDHKGRIVEPREAMDWVSLAMEQGDERARRIERDVRELEADARCGYFCDDDDGSPRLSLAPTRLAARTRWRTRRRQASANIK